MNDERYYLCVVEWYDADGKNHERSLIYPTTDARSAAIRAAGAMHFTDDASRLSSTRVYELAKYDSLIFPASRAPEWVV